MANTLKKFFKQHQNLLASLIIFLVLLTFYNDVVFRGRTFLMENLVAGTLPDGVFVHQRPIDAGAIAWTAEPLNRFISRSIKEGDFPLWNPYSGLAGTPVFQDGSTGPLEPVQFLFYLFPDSLWIYTNDIQLLVRFFLAGFFCYLFARRLKIGFLGEILSGILFMLCTYLVRYGNHPQVKPDVLLPLIVYCFDRLADNEDKKAIWISAFAICWIMFAAMPESTFFAFFLGSLWFFYKLVWNVIGHPHPYKVAGSALARYISALTLGFALSAVYLIPFIELILNGASTHHPGTTSNYFLPFWALASFVIVIPQPVDLLRYHIGFSLIALSILAIITVNKQNAFKKETYFFACYVIFSLLVIFNFPPVSWICKLPILSQVIFSKYALPSMVLCLSLLAGITIQRLPTGIFSKQNVALILVVEYLIFFILPIIVNFSDFKEIYFHRDVAPPLLFTIMSAVVIYSLSVLYSSQKLRGGLLQYLLVLIVCAEPFFWNIDFDKPNRVEPFEPPSFVKFLQSDPSPYRIFGTDHYLYPNISSAYKIQDIRYLYAILPKTTYGFATQLIAPDQYAIRLSGDEMPISYKMFDLLNVKYIIGSKSLNIDNYALAYQEDSINIYQNTGGAQPVFFFNDINSVSDFNGALDYLINAQTDFYTSAVVENVPTDLVSQINNYKDSDFELLGYQHVKSGQLEITAETNHPGLLMVSTQYFPGWKAEIDGKASQIYETDGMFIGVFLNTGLHKLVLKYDPISLKIGLIISLCALIFILALILGSSPITSILSRFIRKNRR